MILSSDLSVYLPALVGAIASFLGAWLAARLALGRFYRERIWERKVAAYGAIFEALHDMRQWFEHNLTAAQLRCDMPEERQTKLGETYQKATADLTRRLDVECWLIPQACQDRLFLLTQKLSKNDPDWEGFLDGGAFAIDRTIKDLRILVRKDLQMRETLVERLATKIRRRNLNGQFVLQTLPEK